MPKPLPELKSIHTIVFDFDGVFTDNKVWVDQDGRESVRCDRGDGLAFDFLRAYQKQGKIAVDAFILSKETNSVVHARARKLKLDCHNATQDKLSFVTERLAANFSDHHDPFAGLVYVGNDLNDLPMMRKAGYSVAPADAHPKVVEIADLVLPQRGGEGFVRAFLEQLLGLNHLTDRDLDDLISHC